MHCCSKVMGTTKCKMHYFIFVFFQFKVIRVHDAVGYSVWDSRHIKTLYTLKPLKYIFNLNINLPKIYSENIYSLKHDEWEQ